MQTINKIGIAGDHAGFPLKSEVIAALTAQGFEMKDFGPFNLDSVDYPDFAHPLAEAVANGTVDRGIVICGSGIGVSITVNRHKGVRGALVWNAELASLCRQHNNANIICLGARFTPPADALDFIRIFLETPFEGGRHEKRVEKID
jgi:ribose 5-phosphate isomerase B